MRKFICSFTILVLLLCCGCGRSGSGSSSLSSEPALSAPVTLSVGYTAPPSSSVHTMLQDLADELYSRSKGMISLELYGEGELGTEAELAEQVMSGQLDAAILSSDTLRPYCNKLSALRLPFLFKDYNEAEAVIGSEVGEEILEELTDSHMVPLCYASGYLWQISNALRPVEKPADLTGMMLRTTDDELTLTVYENFAALPAPLDKEELLPALERQVFNGQVGSITAFGALELAGTQPNLSIMNIQYDTDVLVASESFWDSLPPSGRELILDCAKEEAAEHRSFIQTNEETILKGLRTSNDVREPSLKAFKEQSEILYEDYARQNSWGEDLIQKIKAQRKEAAAP